MPFSRLTLAIGLLAIGADPASAACQFSPFSFFPDRNDTVDIRVRTEPGEQCSMAFSEGPGYRFTKASLLKGPANGILARTGPTKFTYLPVGTFTGETSYTIKLCAVVHGRNGCSTLNYLVDVD